MPEKPTTKQLSPSVLDKFNLDFEYNITWHDAKKAVRVRTLK